MIEADFQSAYGIDLSEPGLLDRRSARWLRVRISGLLAPSTTETLIGAKGAVLLPKCTSRLYLALFPPEVPA